ncbi:AAA family ATPase [Exiguobacterium sp.]|uniref:AAA family ATPase n=1 Tax=Exiguobacterium sp. TaxID=44751 RepID=UPI0028A228C9|nr:AAA family ATPase [Exiguobacterium sp.]
MMQGDTEYGWLANSIERSVQRREINDVMDSMVMLIKFKHQINKTQNRMDLSIVDRDFSKLIHCIADETNATKSILLLQALYLEISAPALTSYLQLTFSEVGIRVGEALPTIDQTNANSFYLIFKRVRILCDLASRRNIDMSKTLEWINFSLNQVKKQPNYDQPVPQIEVKDVLKELEAMIGLSNVKKEVKELLHWLEFNQLRKQAGFKTSPITLHTIYSGSPGTGKTTIARLIGKLFKAMKIVSKGHVVEVTRQDLVAEYVGQTAIKTQKQIDLAMGGLLFIDEAYTLARGQESDFGREAIDTLVKAMEDRRDQFILILAGYDQEMKGLLRMNPGLESRFTRTFHFKDYTSDELLNIAKKMLKEQQYHLEEGAEQELKYFLEGEKMTGNGRLVRNIVERMIIQKAVKTVEDKQSDLQLITKDIVFKSTLALSKS